MNRKKTNWLIIVIVFTTSVLVAFAQSGKVIQKETNSTQSSRSEVIQEKQPDAQSNLISRDSGDKYKFVFPTSYEGRLSDKKKRQPEYDQERDSMFKNFSDQLNEFGRKNYKVIYTLPSALIAIVAPDETQHEYELFVTHGSVFFYKSGLQEKIQEMAEKGFRLIAHSQIAAYCYQTSKYDDPILLEKCNYVDRFLIEKENRFKKPIGQILLNTYPGWGAKPNVDLKEQIDEKLAEGFYPTKVVSKFEILLDKTKNKDDLLSDKPDVQVINSSFLRSNLDDKVNELAKQGYRIALTNNGVVVMYRNAETTQIPVSYIWVKADKKNFEKDLAKLQAAGAVYRTTYPNGQGKLNSLIFEQKLKDDGKRAEFKILNIEFDSKENQAEKKVYVDLTPSSKEAVKTMNALAKEGFEVRDLFYSDKVSVILERIR